MEHMVTPDKVHVVISKIGIGTSHYFENPNDVTKMDQIRKLLDPGKSDRDKLEGMKHLMAWTSKGKDVSSFFPDVVKNVVCSNLEVKKLVYLYLSHYAELAPEPALLAINTLKKEIDNSNQLVRAHALRVMSSIRVRVILPIVMLSIQKATTDSSPYVRKTAAHSLLKMYSMDIELKDQLVEIIQQLLTDSSTMVVGSVIVAFNQICPDRFDLLHPHFRKLCTLLPNVDEWGQVALLTTLLHYSRTQFSDPNKGRSSKKINGKPRKSSAAAKSFFGDDSDQSESGSGGEDDEVDMELDPDHQLLLRSALPLLQSRNNAVVLSVVQLYYHLAPFEELGKITKPLIRIMKTNKESEYVVLSNVVTLSAQFPIHYQPYLSEFFVSSTDPKYIKKLKLEILTNIANESNINKLLKEFNTYVHGDEKEFVAAAIQAIGRCASSIPQVIETCISGLMALLTSRSEVVVAESVIVIKNLLQMGSSKKDKLVAQLARMLDKISEPNARASIVWVIGEYSDSIKLLAPDIFRGLAKTFSNEEDTTKLQILNLGAKLFLNNRAQTEALFQYILTQAKYDVNYDIRDRGRLMRKLFFENQGVLLEHAVKLFLQPKPTPVISNPLEDRKRFMVGSLSHLVNHTTIGYLPLSTFPAVTPDASVRNVVVKAAATVPGTPFATADGPKMNLDKFLEDEESGSGSESESESESGSESGSSSSSSSDSESDSESSSSSDSEEQPKKKATAKKEAPAPTKQVSTPSKVSSKPSKAPSTAPPASSAFDELFSMPSPVMGPTQTPAPFTPTASPSSPFPSFAKPDDVLSPILPRNSLLKHFNAGGLAVEYTFSRRDSTFGEKFSTIQLFFTNQTQKPITSIRIGKMNLEPGMQMKPFTDINVILPLTQTSAVISIQFTSVSQPAKFDICHEGGQFPVVLSPSVGELLRPITITPNQFDDMEKQIGTAFRSESAVMLSNPSTQIPVLSRRVLEVANVSIASSNVDQGVFKYGGRAFLFDKPVLISISIPSSTGQGSCVVSCENSVMANMLLPVIKKAITKE